MESAEYLRELAARCDESAEAIYAAEQTDDRERRRTAASMAMSDLFRAAAALRSASDLLADPRLAAWD